MCIRKERLLGLDMDFRGGTNGRCDTVALEGQTVEIIPVNRGWGGGLGLGTQLARPQINDYKLWWQKG